MAIPSFNSIRNRLGGKTAIAVAGTVGFAIGAAGFAAAQDGPPERDAVGAAATTSATVSVDGTVAATTPDTTTAVTTDTAPDTSLVSPTSVDISVPTVVADTIEDGAASTAPDNTIDDDVSTTAPDDTAVNTIDDDTTNSTAPDNTIDDDNDDSTSSTAPSDTVDDTIPTRTVPAPFTETYASAGGSISVGWSGTAFSLNSISPAPGFVAEIEDNAWDRVRVDFEGDDDDFRIEVRLNDGSIRVRID